MMKTRFRAIFLQALEVHHTFVPHVSNHSTGFFRILKKSKSKSINYYYFLPFQVITACAILHTICLGAEDIMAPEEEDEPEEDVEEDEGENGLEASSGAPWRDQLSAEVSALEEAPPDHEYF